MVFCTVHDSYSKFKMRYIDVSGVKFLSVNKVVIASSAYKNGRGSYLPGTKHSVFQYKPVRMLDPQVELTCN
jgi:hypothetical protein